MRLFKNRRLTFLTGSVVAVHLFFFFFDFKNKKRSPPPKKSIVVRTFSPRPSPKLKIAAQRERAQSSKKNQQAKSSVTTEKSKKNKVLKELKDSLTKLEIAPPVEQKDVLTFPKTIQSLQLDQTEPPEISDYFALLAQSMKEELELPEHGNVKLELTVFNNGKVLKVRVLNATSEKNRRYLELNLPRMALPPFDEGFENEHEHTFTLTFCNEI